MNKNNKIHQESCSSCFPFQGAWGYGHDNRWGGYGHGPGYGPRRSPWGYGLDKYPRGYGRPLGYGSGWYSYPGSGPCGYGRCNSPWGGPY